MICIYAKLIEYRIDPGDYIVYVFKDLNSGAPVPCTKLPHWELPIIALGSVGYLKFEDVLGGVDTWYNPRTGEQIPYNYHGTYLLDFIAEHKKVENTLVV